jgi:phosphatidylglycerol:prolipoprotein diacylglycerol transferase
VFPELMNLGPFTIHTYGFFLAVGAASGLWLLSRLAKSNGLNPERAGNLALIVLVAGLIGSRIVFIILEWESFAPNPLRIRKFWEGGPGVLRRHSPGGAGGPVFHAALERLPAAEGAGLLGPGPGPGPGLWPPGLLLGGLLLRPALGWLVRGHLYRPKTLAPTQYPPAPHPDLQRPGAVRNLRAFAAHLGPAQIRRSDLFSPTG